MPVHRTPKTSLATRLIAQTFALAGLLGAGSSALASSSDQAACTSGTPLPAEARGAHESESLDLVLLTADNGLACVSERRPSRVQRAANINGLQGDQRILGIDHRVQDGLLYGLGDAGGVYTLDVATGNATLVNRLSVALQGSRVAIDFNPVADRLRIVTDAGQNLRHNVNAGGLTLVDAGLNYAAGTTATGIAAAAYTNNDLSAATPATTATTLFVLDAALDQVALQSPPNAGSLVATGKLGVDTTAVAGLDIYSTVRGQVTVRNRALAVLSAADGSAALYRVDPLTGSATVAGRLPQGLTVLDLAVPLYQD
jgi:hypothetical protein